MTWSPFQILMVVAVLLPCWPVALWIWASRRQARTQKRPALRLLQGGLARRVS